jgi:hypothetical protein
VVGIPQWVGPDGFPLSWRHYVHGLRHLALAHIREQVKTAEAVRFGAQADQESYQGWHRDMTRFTSVPRE